MALPLVEDLHESPQFIPAAFQLSRRIMIVFSVMLLLHAVAYGPGRGGQLIPLFFEYGSALYTLKIFVYLMFVYGAVISVKRPGRAALVLGMALVGRSVMEWIIPVGKMTLSLEAALGWVVMVLGYYANSFVHPTLHFIDCIHLYRKMRVSPLEAEASNPTV